MKKNTKSNTNRVKFRLQLRFILLATVFIVLSVTVMVVTLNSMIRNHTDSDAYTKIDWIESRNGVLSAPEPTPIPKDDTDDTEDEDSSNPAPMSTNAAPRERKWRRNWNGDGGPGGSQDPFGGAFDQVSYIFAASDVNSSGYDDIRIRNGIESLSDDDARSLAVRVLSDGRKEGRFEETYHFRIWNEDDKTRLVVLNTALSQQYDSKTLTSSIETAAIVVIVTFILFCLLSGRVVRPFTESLQKQKQFITDASHEIKTPLTIIAANVDVLEMTGMEDNKWLQSIKNQTGRLNKLVKSMVLLARTDEGGAKEETLPVDLSAAAAEIWGSFGPLFDDRGITSTAMIDGGVTVNGNEDQLCQLISILCENALKYTPAGGTYTMSLARHGKKARLECVNTCAEPQQIDTKRIFDRFYRADASHNSQTGGNGIGLSVAKAIVENHRGRISASIKDDKISFTVEI